MIRFTCPNCGRRIKVSSRHAGRKGRCPDCRAAVMVPSPKSEAAPHAADGPRQLLPPVAKPPDDEEMIDMTAMVDIVFFLLIFFMVTSLGARQASIEMPAPAASSSSTGDKTTKRTAEDFEADENYAVVRIDEDNTVWIEDAEAMTDSDLHKKLRDVITRGPADQPRLLVLGHADALHGTAVRVLDAAREVGARDVRFAVEDDAE